MSTFNAEELALFKKLYMEKLDAYRKLLEKQKKDQEKVEMMKTKERFILEIIATNVTINTVILDIDNAYQ